MRSTSDTPCKNGGWLHHLDSKSQPVVPKVETPRPTINAAKMMREFTPDTRLEMVGRLADDLHVSCQSLIDLCVAWAEPYQAWAWPMRDAWGEIIGIRLRSDTRKWAVTGSRAGLFFAPGPIEPTVYVTEGGSDAAAAMTLGLSAVGRHACRGQEDMLCDRLRGSRSVLIVADNDRPGLEGADALQRRLRVPSLIWCPPTKDLREFVQQGGTKALLESMIRGLQWTQPNRD